MTILREYRRAKKHLTFITPPCQCRVASNALIHLDTGIISPLSSVGYCSTNLKVLLSSMHGILIYPLVEISWRNSVLTLSLQVHAATPLPAPPFFSGHRFQWSASCYSVPLFGLLLPVVGSRGRSPTILPGKLFLRGAPQRYRAGRQRGQLVGAFLQ